MTTIKYVQGQLCQSNKKDINLSCTGLICVQYDNTEASSETNFGQLHVSKEKDLRSYPSNNACTL